MKTTNLNTKLEIEENLGMYVDADTTLCGSLQDVSNNILALEDRLRKEHAMVTQNPNLYIKFKINVQTTSCYGDPDYIDIKLSGIRLETDAEFEKRIDKHNKAVIAGKLSAEKKAESNEKRELANFLRLKNKFENNK